MKLKSTLIALVLSLSAPAIAQANDTSCQSPVIGEHKYSFRIELATGNVSIQQQSMIARYLPIDHAIVEEGDISAELPSVEPEFACVSEEGKHNYRAEIQVFEDRVVLLQSSSIARYAPLTFLFVKEDEPVAEKLSFSCNSGIVGANGYRFAIELDGNTATVLQQSIIARYAPLNLNLERNDALELPLGEPEFSCTSEEGPHGYTATIEVFEDSVFVLQQSAIARYAPIGFSIVKE